MWLIITRDRMWTVTTTGGDFQAWCEGMVRAFRNYYASKGNQGKKLLWQIPRWKSKALEQDTISTRSHNVPWEGGSSPTGKIPTAVIPGTPSTCAALSSFFHQQRKPKKNPHNHSSELRKSWTSIWWTFFKDSLEKSQGSGYHISNWHHCTTVKRGEYLRAKHQVL